MLGNINLPSLIKFSRKRWAEQVDFLPYEEAKLEFEKEYFSGLLKFSRGNVAMAARFARRDKSHLYGTLRKCGIDLRKYR